MLKLTEEEQVFAKQLWEHRETVKKLSVEIETHKDRLMTILRGHGVDQAMAGDYLVIKYMRDANGTIEEDIIILREY